MTASAPDDVIVLELRLSEQLASDPNAAARATARLLECAGELGLAVRARGAPPELERRRRVRFSIG